MKSTPGSIHLTHSVLEYDENALVTEIQQKLSGITEVDLTKNDSLSVTPITTETT